MDRSGLSSSDIKASHQYIWKFLNPKTHPSQGHVIPDFTIGPFNKALCIKDHIKSIAFILYLNLIFIFVFKCFTALT